MTALEQRIRATAQRYIPAGWRVRERRTRHGCDGMACYHNLTIYCPKLTTPYALYVLLHEVGHVVSPGHLYPGRTQADDLDLGWITEYEAEMFAIGTMRRAGFRVGRAMADAARAYVAETFEERHDLGDLDHPYFRKALQFAFPLTWRTKL